MFAVFASLCMVSINDNNREACHGWLLIGVHSLGISGILSILIVFLRVPFFKSMVSNADRLFDLSLVIHVNCSVLVWLCAMSSLLISMTYNKRSKYVNYIWTISAVGSIIMALSAVSRNAVPIKSNYIPVIDNTTFFTGLALFFAGVVLNTSPSVLRTSSLRASPTLAGIYGISAMLSAVLICFISAHAVTVSGADRLQFYEQIFWGAGHLLQGVFSQTFLVVLLLEIGECRFANRYLLSAVFLINTASVVIASAAHLVHPSDFDALATFFTWHMRIAEGVIPLFLVFFTIANLRLLLKLDNRHLLYSSAIFIYGSILGVLSIHGTVTIPAHYHGCVVGMTAAFMGFIYSLLPKLGYEAVSLRWRNAQLGLYSAGQVLHITGLELLGGYGALRKVTHIPDAASKLAKHCFSFGGALAILGGSLFILLTLICIYKNKARTSKVGL
ncbi:cytochrome c oxidase subunit I [Anaplasma platys]|uniref:Cytochrome c oxidase subunit I n=1 Tax=Anaplasma platys TaxID=949 RepID=A0A858PZ80_9RICK|nr:cbb3-type cytochrome c oxidase subunit I [Anaplasma platys]QJC27864.1 cytochrome c oxidase subunit I [Anaplasma platys]